MMAVLSISVGQERPTTFERGLSETMLQTGRGAGWPKREFPNA